MLDQEFIGKLVSISTKLKKVKNEEDEKMTIPFKKVTLVSSSIEYDEFAKTFPEIYNVITVIEPSPIKNASFGEQNLGRLQLSIKFLENDEVEFTTGNEFVSFNDVEIKQLSIKNDDGIIYYKFVLEFLTSNNDKYLDEFIGDSVEIKFSKLEVE